MKLRRAIISGVVALMATPAAANAAWIHDAQTGATLQPYAGWAATSYAPAPNANVELHTAPEHLTFGPNGEPEDAPQYLCTLNGVEHTACAASWGDHWTIRMYYDLGHWTPLEARAVFLHELGHVFDGTMMNDQARVTFERLAGLHGPWRPDPPVAAPPFERFAEAYKDCAFYGRHYDPVNLTVPPQYGFMPSRRTYRRLCHLIYRVGTGT